VLTTFVRFSGCPLRCRWCDTEYAFRGGTAYTLPQILTKISSFNSPYVCLTGGEPLAQADILELTSQLCDSGYQVSIETGGMLPIAGIDARVLVVLDVKAPGSGEVARNYWENLHNLGDNVEVKFVLASREDYDWARSIMTEYDLSGQRVLLSAVAGVLMPRTLADWIVADRLDVRFQMQLHKVLWGDERGR
jgi:7-carboxy-7-deazaguanine synthase